jgi:broad specificity phosphatase PhoE
MTEPLRIYLVRHGETAWSVTGQHTGSTDLGLTPRGKEQARALAPRLRHIDFDRVLVSPMLRACQTCVLAGLDAASTLEPQLQEWDYGDYEGLRSVDIHQQFPDWNVWYDGGPNGESTCDLSARADRLLAWLSRLQGNIALFSHGHFCAALAVRWIGLPLYTGQHFALDPGSLSMLGYSALHPERRVIGLWNEIPVLPDA